MDAKYNWFKRKGGKHHAHGKVYKPGEPIPFPPGTTDPGADFVLLQLSATDAEELGAEGETAPPPYSIEPSTRTKATGMFDVVNTASEKPMNAKPLRLPQAKKLLSELTAPPSEEGDE